MSIGHPSPFFCRFGTLRSKHGIAVRRRFPLGRRGSAAHVALVPAGGRGERRAGCRRFYPVAILLLPRPPARLSFPFALSAFHRLVRPMPLVGSFSRFVLVLRVRRVVLT